MNLNEDLFIWSQVSSEMYLFQQPRDKALNFISVHTKACQQAVSGKRAVCCYLASIPGGGGGGFFLAIFFWGFAAGWVACSQLD